METNFVSKEDGSQANKLQNENPVFQEYIDSAKAAFSRAWLNRYLWFWGIFLPLGAGLGSSFNFGNFAEDEVVSGESFKQGLDQGLEFFREYLVWIVVGVIIIVLINILAWLLSAIARRGVIQAINELQTPTKAISFNFKEIWRVGKVNMGNLLLFDVCITLTVLVIILILATPIIFLALKGNIVGAIFVGLVALLVIFLVTLIAGYIKQVGAILIVLSNQKPLQAIEASYMFISNNFIPAVKLFVVNFVLGMIRGFVSFGVFFVVGVVVLIVALFFNFTFGGYSEIFNNPEESMGKIITLGFLGGIAFLAIFIIGLIVKGFFSLWQQDIWVWWVKRLGGINVFNDVVFEEQLVGLPKTETATTTNSNITKN